MQRLRKVVVRGFQSLADVELEVGALTVVTGATGAGKSAVVRALQAALFNWSGGAFVREGVTEATVDLVFDERTLLWRKPRKGGAVYYIQQAYGSPGIVVSRAGKDLPPEITELTGVREIECEGAKAKLQVDAQFDQPFLLAGTGGQAARLLARVSKLDVLLTAQVRARRDWAERRRQLQAAEERVSVLQDQLDALPDYEALLERWRGISDALARVAELQAVVRGCTALAAERDTLLARGRRWALAQARLVAGLKEAQARVRGLETVGDALSRRAAARSEVVGLASRLESYRRQLAKAEGQLSAALTALRVCPVCRRPM